MQDSLNRPINGKRRHVMNDVFSRVFPLMSRIIEIMETDVKPMASKGGHSSRRECVDFSCINPLYT
ncbi:uncharacterized protein SPAPADRAFT_59252, partial [Spathaspora passalidarum NRRL Y-27907]